MKPYSYWEPDFGQEDVRQKDELTGRYSPSGATARTLAEGQRHRSLGHRRHRPRNRANPDVGVTTDARAHPHWLTANLNMVRSLPNHGSRERVCPQLTRQPVWPMKRYSWEPQIQLCADKISETRPLEAFWKKKAEAQIGRRKIPCPCIANRVLRPLLFARAFNVTRLADEAVSWQVLDRRPGSSQ